MKRAFTLVEMLLAVVILGLMTTVSIISFYTISNSWQASCEYLDKLERTDYALDQLLSGLKCAYYPHTGEQSYDYGFQLTDNGDGESPRESDIIEWTKKGAAMVGGSSVGDALHRVQVRVLEEGDTTWGERIERTGLYARVRPVAKVVPDERNSHHDDENEFTFENDELYRPVLIAKDVEGFNCRVLPKEPDDVGGKKKSDKSDFEDTFDASNSVPYKVQLTFYVLKQDPEFASRKSRMPVMRVVRMPVHEQSSDGAALPGDEKSDSKGKSSGGRSGGRTGGGRTVGGGRR